ncbi:hypothetical protein [Bacillus sp. FJAT-44742]|uniref:hypothetical protein n=1 Tax=Bacillus sp. FJAT-44742 TaxID=2014005 RepID=UPI000C23FA2B|nr:hypothetical protein [Bacillus sp. FJAT-44742]
MSQNGRGLGGKRCSRRSISLSNSYDDKAKKLAIACSMPTATLLSEIIEVALDSPQLVNMFQERYNKDPKYKVVVVRVGGKIEYS